MYEKTPYGDDKSALGALMHSSMKVSKRFSTISSFFLLMEGSHEVSLFHFQFFYVYCHYYPYPHDLPKVYYPYPHDQSYDFH